jgi:hypothetical protein
MAKRGSYRFARSVLEFLGILSLLFIVVIVKSRCDARPGDAEDEGTTLAWQLSLLTFLLSTGAWVATTLLARRKDARDARQAGNDRD